MLKNPERVVIQFDSNNNNNVNKSVSPLLIRLAGPIPYSSDKDVPYKYNATMVENGKEAPLPVASSVVNIVAIVNETRSGCVFGLVPPRIMEGISAGKKEDASAVDPINAPTCQSYESSGLRIKDDDELLRLIKKSEFNIVDQLLQTPSKISLLSLLMNFEAHRWPCRKCWDKLM